MEFKYDICACGDIICDMTPLPDSCPGKMTFTCNIGGTSSNMAVATARLGMKTLLVGCLGDDVVGHDAYDMIREKGVITDCIVFDKHAFTTLSFVRLHNGERSFSFSRFNSADTNLRLEDIDIEKTDQARIFHFSGMCLTNEPTRSTTLFLLDRARSAGKLVDIDVNYRDALWESEAKYIEELWSVVPKIDFFKASEEEIELLTGEKDIEVASRMIAEKGPKLIIISRGPKGAFFRFGDECGALPTYDIKPVDTTGAGDCFMGAILYSIIKRGGSIDDLTAEELYEIIDFANAAGAISIATRGGAISMPTIDQIIECRKTVPRLEIK